MFRRLKKRILKISILIKTMEIQNKVIESINDDKSIVILDIKDDKPTEKQLNFIETISKKINDPKFTKYRKDIKTKKDANMLILNYKTILKKVPDEYFEFYEYYKDKLVYESKNFCDFTFYHLNKFLIKNPELAFMIKKPRCIYHKEIPLINNQDFQVGINYKSMFYIKFYDLLMIDHDFDDPDLFYAINNFCENNKEFLFKVYKTTKGYHYILISHTIPYYKREALDLMKELKSDYLYNAFSFSNGFNYRLTKKYDDEPFVVKFNGYIGHGISSEKALNLVEIHDKYIEEFKDFGSRLGVKNSIIKFEEKLVIDKSVKSVSLYEKYANDVYKTFNIDKEYFKYNNFFKQNVRLLEDGPDYFIGTTILMNYNFIMFKNLCVIDIDDNKLDYKNYLNVNFDVEKDCVHVFKTNHGYHFFITSEEMPMDEKVFSFMKSKNSDPNYAIFSYLKKTYSIRLNRKYKEENPIYKRLGFFGKKENEDRRLAYLTDYHYILSMKYNEVDSVRY